MSLSFNEIKDLIGKPGVKLEVRSQFGDVMGVGELVGVLEQPSALIRHEDGTQHHHAASQTYHLLHEPPTEPSEDGTVVSAHSEGNKVFTYSRRESVHRIAHPNHPGEYCWWWHDDGSWVCWRDICKYEEITVLVPDPVASAPELPFRDLCGEVQANKPGYDMHHPVRIAIERSFYSADDAERVGLAILRAAREARADS